MNQNQIATAVIHEAINIHKTLGPGLLESAYEIIIDHKLHQAQLLSYLRVSSKKLGLVLNFGMSLMHDGIARVANGLE